MRAYRFAAWITFVFLFAIAAGAQLVGPPVPDDREVRNCVHNVRISERLGVSLSCDSWYFMYLSISPHHLYDLKNVRQARPGVVFITFLLAQPLRPFVDLPRWIGMPEPPDRANHPGYLKVYWAKEAPTYLAYIEFNFAILIATFWLLLKATESLAPNGALAGIGVGAIGSLLTANHVTKMFLWSPHTTLLSIFVGAFTIAATISILQSGLSRRNAVVFGLTIGIGMTIYQVFPIALAFIVLAALLRPFPETAKNLAILVAYSVAPYLIWYIFVRLKNGEFYSHEMQGYDQITWMLDALRDGTFFPRLTQQLQTMINGAIGQSYVLLAMLAIAGFLGLAARSRMAPNGHSLVLIGGVSALVMLAGALFFALVGLAENRTAYIMIPPIVVATAALFAASAQRTSPLLQTLAALAVVALAIYNIVEIGLYRVVWA
jgi:hypothetical protein